MGAKIEGVGQSVLTVHGVEKLNPISHRVIGDRVVAATWAFAAAMTRGDITVTGINPDYLTVVLMKLQSAGADVDTWEDGFRVRQESRPVATNFQTLPYPGFPTDLQPMAIGLSCDCRRGVDGDGECV